MTQLGSEDLKIVQLARAARARTGTAEGAAVRDTDGRTYAASTVSLRPALSLSALELSVAMAVSSGAGGLEAAAVVRQGVATDAEARTDTEVPGTDTGGNGVEAVRALGGEGLPVFFAGADGQVREVRRT